MKRATVAHQLKRYRGKRNFVKTPEPAGHPGGHRRPADGPIYVVQKHAAGGSGDVRARGFAEVLGKPLVCQRL